MSGIFGILNIANQALLAEQTAVEVVSHNIANVGTPGYSRQIPVFEATLPVPSGWNILGTGVKIDQIRRAFDPYATARLDENTAYLAQSQAQQTGLEQVASLFNETQDGSMNGLIANFWAAWQDLADNPAGAAERQALLVRTQTLSEAFNYRADQLAQAKTAVIQQIDPTIDSIDTHLTRIAQLNGEIIQSEAGGANANDLRDQRQQHLTELSNLVGIRYYTTGEGYINVTTSNGASLVQGPIAFSLASQQNADGTTSILWQGPNGTSQDITSGLSGGKLGAQVQMVNNFIPQYQTSLDDLALSFIAAVNEQHSQGVGLDLFSSVTGTYAVSDPNAALSNNPDLVFGNRIDDNNTAFTIHVEDNGVLAASGQITVTPGMTLNQLVSAINSDANLSPYITASVVNGSLSITADNSAYAFGFAQDSSNVLMALGVNTFLSGKNAFSLEVNSDVLANPNLIGTGRFSATGTRAAGDNSNALDLADLADALVGPGNQTIGGAYSQLVEDMGLDAEQAGDQATYYKGMVEQFAALRDSVSGVSLDEELSNLIKYQRGFQAASKMVATADEMLQTLLEIR